MPVLSDECYAEFTWDRPARTVLAGGLDGVVAVHSLSKRSNLAGVRAGFFAGDPELVGYLLDVRRHAGLMVPGPVQAGAVAALDDDAHVEDQRQRYRERLGFLAAAWPARAAASAPMPAGGFYLWVPVPGADGRRRLGAGPRAGRREPGCWSAPASSTVPTGRGHVRVAVVQPMERLALVAERLSTAAQAPTVAG